MCVLESNVAVDSANCDRRRLSNTAKYKYTLHDPSYYYTVPQKRPRVIF